MSLAKLTIDLEFALSKFEGDSGRAAQIVARDSEKMSRAARSVATALQKQADQAGRSTAEFLALRAAEAGLSHGFDDLIVSVARGSAATATFTAESLGLFKSVEAAAAAAGESQLSTNAALVASIRRVNAAYAERRGQLVGQEKAGTLSTDQFKATLTGLTALRDQSIKTLKQDAEQERAERAVAAAAEEAAQRRVVAAQRAIDAENGLTASYRTELRALRELRDAGDLTPKQFRAAGAALVAKNPAVQQREQEAAALERAAQAEAAVIAKRAAAFDQLRNTVAAKNFATGLAELAAAKRVAAAEAEIVAKRGTAFEQLRQTVSRAAYEAEQAEQVSIDRRAATAQRLIDVENGLTATYRSELAALRELRDAGNITPAQFKTAGKALVNKNPVVQQRQADAEAAEQAAAKITASNTAFIASLEKQSTAIGKSRAELLALEAAERGLTTQAQPLITKILEAEKNLNKFGTTTKISQFQLQQLHYTVSDVVASLASGISPLTILAQQGGQVRDAFGGFGAAFKGIASVFTVANVTIGASAAAVGVLAYAYYEGSKQSKAFADSLVATGNYAGVTEGQYNDLAKSVATSARVSVSASREVTQALIGTGEIGPKALAGAAEAAALYGKATGKTAQDVAAEFAAMTHDVSGWAAAHNKQLNFITAAQYAQIRSLQDQGKTAEATGVVFDALSARFKKLDDNLGTIERTLRDTKKDWSDFWDAALDVGRTETLEDKIKKAEESLKRLTSLHATPAAGLVAPQAAGTLNAFLSNLGLGGGPAAEQAAELAGLRAQKAEKDAAAAATAAQREVEKRGIDAQEFVRGYLERAKSVDALRIAMEKAQTGFAASAAAGRPVSDARQKEVLDQIRKDFTNPELEQAAQAQADRAIKALNDRLQQERDLLAFHNAYVQGQYNAGAVSLQHFYDDRQATLEKSTADEVAILEKQKAVLRDLLGKIPAFDTSKTVETRGKIAELTAAQVKAQADATRAGIIADQEREASLDALVARVVDFRAQLAQLEGDEKGAAALRAQNAENAAKRFQGAAGTSTVSDEELARMKEATRVANDFAEVQRKVGLLTADAARLEETFILRQTQTGGDLISTERGIYQIRATELVQLGELRDKAAALAAVTKDPKIAAGAADLALQYKKAAEAVDPALNRLREATHGLADSIANDIGSGIDEFKSLGDVAASVAKDIERYFTKLVITDPLKEGLQGLLRALSEGDNPLGNFFKSTLKIGGAGSIADPAELARQQAVVSSTAAITLQTQASGELAFSTYDAQIALDLMTESAYAAAEALDLVASSGGGGGLGGLFGSAGGGSGLEGLSPEDLSYFFGGHGGGIAGHFGSPLQARASDFVGAPRYHSGGVVGLQPDEVASILRRDEEVITRDDPRHRWNGGRQQGGAGMTMPVSVNLTNNGEPAQAKGSARQTDKGLMIDLILDTVQDNIDSNGRLARSIGRRTGTSTVAGAPRRQRSV